MNRRSFFQRALMAVAGLALAQKIALSPIQIGSGMISQGSASIVIDPYELVKYDALERIANGIERAYLFGTIKNG